MKRRLFYPDLIDMSAPAHATANVLSQYRLNKRKHNWEKLDQKTLIFHIFEDQLTSHQEIEEVESLKNDLQEWRAAKANLEAEKRCWLRK